MPKKRQKIANEQLGVSEKVRIAVRLALRKFLQDGEPEVLCFPSSFTSDERKFIHQLCLKRGLKTKSKGKHPNRYVTVLRKAEANVAVSDASFFVSPAAQEIIMNLLQQFPLSNKEKQELANHDDCDNPSDDSETQKPLGCLGNILPQVPPPPKCMEPSVLNLPVYRHKALILDTISKHQVTLIQGDTGTGKTTQVPQFILNNSFEQKEPCRILCMQPRRIAALSVSERVAHERGVRVGSTVGYLIRLENKMSLNTLLTFSTMGVLLRTLMTCEERLRTVTHIVVDEIHEREKLSDFLLVVLKFLLPKYPHLKLILMSATLDTDLFIKFFDNCPVIKIESRMYPVTETYLEDILNTLNYRNNKMLRLAQELKNLPEKKRTLESWCSAASPTTGQNPKTKQANDVPMDTSTNVNPEQAREMDDELIKKIDNVYYDAWMEATDDAITNMLQFLINENLPIDQQHSETQVTALIIASARGCLNTVEQLIGLGADVNLKLSNGWTAIDFATNFNQQEIVEFLSAHRMSTVQLGMADLSGLNEGAEDSMLLNVYQQSIGDDKEIDYDLLLLLLTYIHLNMDPGAILVFLPGYANITLLNDKITADHHFQAKSCLVYKLHSSMQSSEQRKVFKKPPSGMRKIILSTNIAETSVTIPDVVYVIDSGKVKQKSYDSVSCVSMLQAVWISKASATQRKGRAGRCQNGHVFRLFSRNQFKYMDDFQCPEILRTPLHELCLQAKSIAPSNVSIANFLALAPEPPLPSDIKNSIELLVNIEALNANEELTEIGRHLLDLPIDPTLGKMVLYAVVLKCLDPVLTIVCSLAYRDPFFLPLEANHKRRVMQVRRNFAANSLSDHMVLLRAFQSWQKAQGEGHEKPYCQQNYLSPAMMEMIAGMRSQLIGQLRASGFVRPKGTGDIKDLNANSEKWAIVKVALFVGMYPNVIRIDKAAKKMITKHIKKVKFHTVSILNPDVTSANQNMEESYKQFVKNAQTDWLMFDDMTKNGHISMARSATVIAPIAIALFGGQSKLPPEYVIPVQCANDGGDSDSDTEDNDNYSVFQIDDWISFKLSKTDANLLLHLRQKWHSLFLRRIKNPSKPWSPQDEAVLASVIHVLSEHEQQCGLQQPVGIGQRPRPVHIDYTRDNTSDFRNPSNYSNPGRMRQPYHQSMNTQRQQRRPARPIRGRRPH